MNRDVAIAMYLTIFGSVLILVAMWLTKGFSRITETFSSPLCLCRSCSRSRSCSCSRDRERARRALDQCELEGETEWQTRRPRHLTERCLSGIQRPPAQEEYTSSFFHGWYLPYNVRDPSEPGPEPERELEVDVELEELPRYEHPPAYTNKNPSNEYRSGWHSHRESLDVTERRPALGPGNEGDTMAETMQRNNAENDRRSPDLTEYHKPSGGL
ncbi:hypothetical protein BDW67DRAFT_189514 [Aspergillus spinulosporus]